MTVKLKHLMKAPTSLFFKSAMVFIFFFALFLFVHLSNDQFFSNDDVYYHAKHASLIEQSGQLNLVEPWLEFHFFNYAPVDPWWGFHLGMALFIHWFGLVLGVKVFASLLAALVFLVFYLVLNSLKIKYPAVWTFLLFFSSSIFTYRLFLERPHLLTMIVMPLAFLFLVKGKNAWLFILSLFFVLCYHLAPLIILLTLIYLTIDTYTNKRINLKPLIASAGGILAGIIIHPASLNYLYLIYLHLVKISLFNLSGFDQNFSSELSSVGFFSVLSYNFLAFLLYLLAASLFFVFKKYGNSLVSNFLFLYSSLWFLAALLIPKRGVEFWLPAALLFTAVIFDGFLKTEEFRQVKRWLGKKVNFKVIGFFFVCLLAIIIFRNLILVRCNFHDNTEEIDANYQQATDWLKAKTEKDSVVFYNHELMWPRMFFYNDYNHYIHGIDANFFYEYDKRTFWIWKNISKQGIYCDQAEPCLNLSPAEQIKLVPLTIKTVFRAKYAVVLNLLKDKDRNLIKTLDNLREEAVLVFKNEDLLIYEMK